LEGEFSVELQDLLIWKAGVGRVVVVVLVEEGGPTGVHAWLVVCGVIKAGCCSAVETSELARAGGRGREGVTRNWPGAWGWEG